MGQQTSCGFLIVRGSPPDQFLLMRHADRWDLPKGHVDPGETQLQCALRELHEETSISSPDIEVDPTFRFESHYPVTDKKTSQLVDKTLIIFLAQLIRDVPILCTEHLGYQWFPWQPPHNIQQRTIDPLLAAVAAHLTSR